MTPEQLEQLRLARAEYAALRLTLRREYADLTILALEAATDDAPAPGGLLYACRALKLADTELSTALEALRPLLDDEEAR